MWLASMPDDDDPLRQGDLLVDVVVPHPRVPTPFFSVHQEGGTTVPAVRCNVIVVSQCCDNVTQDYAAVAPIRAMGGLDGNRLAALLATEPTWTDGAMYNFVPATFQLEPDGVVLPDNRPKRYWVAHLDRSVALHGECGRLIAHRRLRMDVERRRDLRNKLGLLWSRPEEGDAEELRKRGLPVGLSRPV